jgi:hypothetical protein
MANAQVRRGARHSHRTHTQYEQRIWVGAQWFYLAGILKPAVLAPEIDSSVLVGYPAAHT